MTLSISGVGSTSATYYIYGLDQVWSDANYSQCCLTRLPASSSGTTGIATLNYLSDSFMSPPSFGFQNQTSTLTFAVTPSTSYTLYASVQKPDGKWYPYGSASFSTPSSGSAPVGSLNLSISDGAFYNTFSLSWDSVSGSGGSTTYELWMKKSSDFLDSYFAYNTSTTNTSIFSLSVSEYRSYDFWLRSKNAIGYGVDQKIYGRYPKNNEPPPTPTGRPYWDEGSAIYVYTNIGYDLEANINPDGSAKCYVTFAGAYEYPTQYQIYANDNQGSGWVLKGTSTTSVGSHLFSLDKTNHTYGIRIGATNSYGASLNYAEGTFTTPYWEGAKPSGWIWPTPKNSGEPFNVTAVEWNDFTARINAFRKYYDKQHSTTLGNYSFTTAPYGDGSFFAFMYNQTVTAINQMNPPTPMPSDTSMTKITDDVIFAKYFNDLRTSLNSIVT